MKWVKIIKGGYVPIFGPKKAPQKLFLGAVYKIIKNRATYWSKWPGGLKNILLGPKTRFLAVFGPNIAQIWHMMGQYDLWESLGAY